MNYVRTMYYKVIVIVYTVIEVWDDTIKFRY